MARAGSYLAGTSGGPRVQYQEGFAGEAQMTGVVRWLVIGTLVAGAAGTAIPVPSLSGRFKLNVAESDDARRKMREGPGRDGGPGGPGGAPSAPEVGGPGPAGGPPGSGGGREPGEAMRAVFSPPEEITIRQSASEVEVEALYGDLRFFRPNGKKAKAENGTAERVAEWKQGALVVQTKSRAGQKITETWSISTDGKRLTVEAKVEGGFAPRLTLRRVYDRIPSAE